MIFLYTLSYCPYSQAAIKFVKELKIPYKEIKVQEDEKNKYKKKHKMETFPQIFFKNSKNKLIKIGGYTDFINIVNFCKSFNN